MVVLALIVIQISHVIFQVSIQLMGIFESTHLCGGVLIDAPGGATIVLTVAYCVERCVVCG